MSSLPTTIPAYLEQLRNALAGADSANYRLGTGFVQSGAQPFVIQRREVSVAALARTQTYGSFAMPGLDGVLAGDQVELFSSLFRNGVQVSHLKVKHSYPLATPTRSETGRKKV